MSLYRLSRVSRVHNGVLVDLTPYVLHALPHLDGVSHVTLALIRDAVAAATGKRDLPDDAYFYSGPSKIGVIVPFSVSVWWEENHA